MHIPFYNPGLERIVHAFVPSHAVPLEKTIVLHIHTGDDVQTHSLKGYIIADDFEYGILVSIDSAQIDTITMDSLPDMITFAIEGENDKINVIDYNEDVHTEASVIGDWVNAAYCIRHMGKKWKFGLQYGRYNMVTNTEATGFKVCLNVDPMLLFNDPEPFLGEEVFEDLDIGDIDGND